MKGDKDRKWHYADYLIPEEDQAEAPAPSWLARFWLPLAASLLAVAIAVAAVIGWRQAGEGDTQGQPYAGDVGLVEAQLLEILPPRQIGEDPSQRQLPPELVGKTKWMLSRGNEEQHAIAKIALRNDSGADFIINALKREPVAKAFRLLTLEGHNWYNAGEFDRAVKFYEQALTLQPEDAEALRNAAIAHSQAKQGDIPAHWGRAIELLKQGLEQAAGGSAQWCELQNNLGLAWTNSPGGERGDNLMQAVAAFGAARDKFACGGDPALWAKLQNNRGVAWLKMAGGGRAGNLRNAVAAFRLALDVYTRDRHPLEWAMAQNNLGEAWMALAELPGGAYGESLAQAVAFFRSALEALGRDEHPLEWAKAQNNLGLALDGLPTGVPADNDRQAIAAFQAAEKVYSRPLHPMEWASVRFNQAAALKHLADTAAKDCGHLWQSMAYLKAAAGVWTPEAFPMSHKNQVEPLARSVREAWRAQGCGDDKTLDEIPAAK